MENKLCSLSKLSVSSPMSQLILILQAFRHFTYVTAHSPTLPSLYLRHNSFSNPSVASPTSQFIHELCSFSKLSVTSPTTQLILILQAFRHFTYVTAQSPTLPSLYLHHSSFSNPFVTSPTSQFILQTLLSFLLRHKLFT